MPHGDSGGGEHPFAGAWAGLLILSLAWGLASEGLFAAVLWVCQRVSPPVWEAGAVVATAALAGPFRLAGLELAGLAGARRRPARIATALVLWGLWAGCLAYLRLTQHHGQSDEEQALPAALAWIRPDMEAFRVLILAPLWGAWAMMIAVQFRRPGAGALAAMAEFAAGCGPVLSAAVMGVLLGGSILYFSFLPWYQLAISAGAILGGIAAGVLAGRRAGGLTRGTLLAANLGAQGGFVLAYLACVAR
ncbi:MAG: hypothetical protein NT031_07640 [Planctomycetota bacterium]|nr:hypothetical protein [Planctomycetota bacterium]